MTPCNPKKEEARESYMMIGKSWGERKPDATKDGEGPARRGNFVKKRGPA